MYHLLNIFIKISISCSIIIILISIINKLAKKHYSNKWRYYIWFALAIRMLLPINLNIIEIPNPFNLLNNSTPQSTELRHNDISANYSVSIDTNKTQNTDTNVEENSLANFPKQQQIPSQPQNLPKIQELKKEITYGNIIMHAKLILPAIWGVGIVIFILFHFIGYFVFRKRVTRWGKPIIYEGLHQIQSELTTELKIKKTIPIKTCKYINTPMILGMLHPVILLPEEEMTYIQLKIIVKHELIHYKHHDIYFKFLLICANALHWFNPFAYYMVRCANNDIEMVCDESVVWLQSEDYRKDYSITILQTITQSQGRKYIPFSTNFYGGKKQMKERFSLIMNGSPKKKGITFFCFIFSLILFTGIIIMSNASTATNVTVKTGAAQTISSKNIAKNKNTSLADTKSILLVGADSNLINVDKYHADSILLASINPKTKVITLTSFLRDMSLQVPDEGITKLQSAFTKGGIDLLKETLETNFDIVIDESVIVDYSGFEKIINLLGGVKVKLTKKEVTYLNSTNFISNPINRNLKFGEQTLNGNQALGYARIRKVSAINGANGDIGRTTRQSLLLQSIYEKYKTADSTTLLSILNTSLAYVDTDIKKADIITYLNAVSETNYTLSVGQIPAEGTYNYAVKNGMSVLEPEIPANQKILKKILE